MLVALKLEHIGRDVDAAFAPYRDVTRMLGVYDMIKPPSRKPWVARITGVDQKYKFKRDFLDSQVDFSQSNSKGSRGVYLYFYLYDGVYQVYENLSWSKARKYFCCVETGEVCEIDEAEVRAWLKTHSE